MRLTEMPANGNQFDSKARALYMDTLPEGFFADTELALPEALSASG